MERFKRTEILFGKENMDKLYNAHVLVVGVGGVGGYVCEMLARSGVGALTMVDFDVVSLSNINRQIIALSSTVGLPKVEVMEKRIKEINPKCVVTSKLLKVNKETIDEVFNSKFNYVVDAIDNLEGKVELIKAAKGRNIPIISAMGAGNRIQIPVFRICDVYKTYNDGLARKFRKMLREQGIESLDVCFCDEKSIPNPNEKVVGSTAYSPSMCGSTISAFVVLKLINE